MKRFHCLRPFLQVWNPVKNMQQEETIHGTEAETVWIQQSYKSIKL